MNKRIGRIVVGAIGSGIFAGSSVLLGLLAFIQLELANLSAMHGLDVEYDRVHTATRCATWAAIFAGVAMISIFQTVSAMRLQPSTPK